jgi:hypothetical protein
VIEPLSSTRYKVQFTAAAALCDKLDRLKELMRASVPDGDLGRILEIAVTEAVERREARRFGKTSRPRKTLAQTDTTPSSSRHVPAAVRRIVYAKAGGRCQFVGSNGRRCGSPHAVEFHHLVPWAHRGGRGPGNIHLLCRTHNAYLAAKDYGQAVMARFRKARNAVGTGSGSAPKPP